MAAKPAGRDQRIRFQKPTRTVGTMGGEAVTWANEGVTVFAAVEALSAREALAIQRNEPRALYKITIPNRRDIRADWRIVWLTNGSRILVIRDMGDLGARPTDRVIVAEEAGDEMTL